MLFLENLENYTNIPNSLFSILKYLKPHLPSPSPLPLITKEEFEIPIQFEIKKIANHYIQKEIPFSIQIFSETILYSKDIPKQIKNPKLLLSYTEDKDFYKLYFGTFNSKKIFFESFQYSDFFPHYSLFNSIYLEP